VAFEQVAPIQADGFLDLMGLAMRDLWTSLGAKVSTAGPIGWRRSHCASQRTRTPGRSGTGDETPIGFLGRSPAESRFAVE
jgi:hypothetical protein